VIRDNPKLNDTKVWNLGLNLDSRRVCLYSSTITWKIF
jgi:hypothetical protein